MYFVAIAFKNGATAEFWANKFDIDIEDSQGYDVLSRFTYEDRSGNEAPIYLLPNQVAGIIVTPPASDGTAGMRITGAK